jgi:hypothetical protein
MIEFVNGTDQQYALLKDSLGDGLCHVYTNCAYPPCCSRPAGRIGFEKEGDTYALFIDKGVTCARASAPSLFLEWLSAGTLRFLDFTDMKEFLRSLRCLY